MIDEKLELLIDQTILDSNPQVLDDEIEDLLENWDERYNAIEYLIEKLENKIKEV